MAYYLECAGEKKDIEAIVLLFDEVKMSLRK